MKFGGILIRILFAINPIVKANLVKIPQRPNLPDNPPPDLVVISPSPFKTDAPAFPSRQKGQRLPLRFRGYIWVRFRCNPQFCSAHFLGLCQRTMRFRLPLTPPSSYMGELPNSHGRTLTDESYVMQGILSGTEFLRVHYRKRSNKIVDRVINSDLF
jgi:hypothetical protein